jgi:hypothetical protein
MPIHKFEQTLEDFCSLEDLDLRLFGREYLPAPHKAPSSLPPGIYAFWLEGWGWLKIGKAGPNSQPRWTSHHYRGCAPSTVAGSLRLDVEINAYFHLELLDTDALSEWIKRHTCRANILMSAGLGNEVLSKLEDFLIKRLNPRYEGRRR